jgi:predicted small secreted protein
MMKKTAIVFLLLIMGVFLAGCTTTPTAGQDAERDTIRAHYEYHDGWSVGIGCYDKVTGYAYNAGTLPAEGVMLNFNLVNTQTGTIRDSRSVFIGPMGAGQSSTFETILDGECMEGYRVDGSVLK